MGRADGAGTTAGRTARQTLRQLEATELQIPRPTPFASGFHPLDDVLNGGIRAGDLLIIGGKPGQGKTIAALQWARHMARTGHTAIFACYEHDEVTLLTRLLACELGEAIAASGGRYGEPRLDRLREDLRGVSTGPQKVREVLDPDPLLGEAEERLHAYAEDLVLVKASGTRTDLGALNDLVDEREGERTALFVDDLQKVPVLPEPDQETERVKKVGRRAAVGGRQRRGVSGPARISAPG